MPQNEQPLIRNEGRIRYLPCPCQETSVYLYSRRVRKDIYFTTRLTSLPRFAAQSGFLAAATTCFLSIVILIVMARKSSSPKVDSLKDLQLTFALSQASRFYHKKMSIVYYMWVCFSIFAVSLTIASTILQYLNFRHFSTEARTALPYIPLFQPPFQGANTAISTSLINEYKIDSIYVQEKPQETRVRHMLLDQYERIFTVTVLSAIVMIAPVMMLIGSSTLLARSTRR